MFDSDDLRLDALSGLVPSAGAPYLGGVLQTRIEAPPADLHHAFNENQIVCKQWLLDRLSATFGGRYGTVYVLGGWYGVLGAMLLNDPRFAVRRVLSIDMDPTCAPVAERINAKHVSESRFRAVTADACRIDYRRLDADSPLAGDTRGGRIARDLVVNTSCEHMASTEAWYRRVPRGMLQAHQSNDYFDCPEHVNCVADIEEFKRQVPMSELRYEGTLARRRYARFMLIGRK